MTFTPRNSDFAAAVTASFAAQGALRAIGTELRAVTPGICVLAAAYSDAVTQQHGFFHGGIIGMLADVAGGYAAMSLVAPGWEVLTAEYKINFIAPAKGSEIVATGTVLRAGRTLIVTRMEVVAIGVDGVARECAVAQQTIMVLPPERF